MVRMSFLLLVLAAAIATAQTPVVAIMPLRPMGEVSLVDSDTATSMLETGLVKSQVFQVVERARISEILAEQEYSYGEYIDESLAVRVGELLSAQHIVLGSLSRVGQLYFLTAKIIDVGTGRTLAADNIEAPRIEQVASGALTMGLRLAGVNASATPGQSPRVGELLIHTSPEGAQLYVNGILRGTSPLLMEGVPLGHVKIEAKHEGMYGQSEIKLDREELVRVDIPMNRQMGRLFVKASDPTAIVRIDGVERGFVRDGVFSDVPEGQRRLELIGAGLYAQMMVTVRPEETVTVAPTLIPVGAIRYTLPPGAEALITGDSLSESVSGEGWMERVPTGEYTVRTTQQDHQTAVETITVARGRTALVEPDLRPSEELRIRIAAEQRLHRRAELEKSLEEQQDRRRALVSRAARLKRSARVLYGVSGALVLGSGVTLTVNLAGDPSAPLMPIGGALGIGGALTAVIGTILILEQPDLEEVDSAIRDLQQRLHDS